MRFVQRDSVGFLMPDNLPILAEPHERLQYARRRKKFADATAAATFHGWNQNTYRSHENGTRGIKRSAARRYAAAFGVNEVWLFTGAGVADAPTTSDEQALIAKYREASDEQKRAVHAMLDALLGRTVQEQPSKASSKRKTN
jgi:hypothetical protein